MTPSSLFHLVSLHSLWVSGYVSAQQLCSAGLLFDRSFTVGLWRQVGVDLVACTGRLCLEQFVFFFTAGDFKLPLKSSLSRLVYRPLYIKEPHIRLQM